MSDLLSAPELTIGLRVGVVAAVVALIGGLLWQQWRGRRLPAGGLLISAAALEALRHHTTMPTVVIGGVALLAVAGLTGDLFHAPLLVRAGLALPGAWLVAVQSDVTARQWEQVALVAFVVVGGALMSDLDRRWRRPLISPALLVLTALGIYVCVPDTEAPLLVLGPIALVALLGWPLDLVRLGSGGAFAILGVLAWVTAFGGVGRQGSVVGSLAALGLIAVEPLSRVVLRFRGPLVPNPRVGAAIGMCIAQGALVGVDTRIAGFRTDPLQAAALAGAATVGALLLCIAAAFLLRQRAVAAKR